MNSFIQFKTISMTLFLSIVLLGACKPDNKKVSACSMVITMDNGPVAGTQFIMVGDSTFSDLSLITKTGEEQTWDFSGIKDQTMKTVVFSADNNPNGLWKGLTLFSKTATGMEMTATKAFSFGFTYYLADPQTYIPYSLGVNSSYIDSYKSFIDVRAESFICGSDQIDSTRTSQGGYNSFKVTGCGKITTPSGTFDCLKYEVTPGPLTKKMEGRLSSNGKWIDISPCFNFIDDSIILFKNKTYLWVSKDKQLPVCSIEVDNNNKIVSVSYLK